MRIYLQGVSFSSGTNSRRMRTIFRDVDTEFTDAGFHVVMGPSGSRKTTLFRLLSKELEPNSGTIRLADEDLAGIPALAVKRKLIARIYQEYLLVPYLSAADNILLAREVVGERISYRQMERVEELLELVGLTQVGVSPVEELSGGEQQRVAIARALSSSQVLLADEPTGALDAENTARIGALLKRLARAGRDDHRRYP